MIRIVSLFFLAVFFLTCADNDLSGSCSTPATVRDLSGLDGCGFVFELEDGSRLIPVRPAVGWCGTPPLPKEVTEDPLFNFQFVNGKKVFINYEHGDGMDICMAGKRVKITCIRKGTNEGL